MLKKMAFSGTLWGQKRLALECKPSKGGSQREAETEETGVLPSSAFRSVFWSLDNSVCEHEYLDIRKRPTFS